MSAICGVCGRGLTQAEVLYAPDASVVCAACFDKVQSTGPTSSGPGMALAVAALAIAAVPFAVSHATTSSVIVDGKVTSFSYRDWIAIVGGATAVMLAVVAIAMTVKTRGKALAIAAVAVVLGGVQVARGLGAFASPDAKGSEHTGIELATHHEPPATESAETCATADACFELGKRLEGTDAQQQLLAFARACDFGQAEGCFGAAYVTRRDHPDDLPPEIGFLTKACERGSPMGCHNLAVRYQDGQGVRADPAKAFELYARGCDLGSDAESGESCDSAGVRLIEGTGIAADGKRGVGYLEKACERNAKICFDLGLARATGAGGAKDLAGARAAYDRACAAGNHDACDNLHALGR